MPVPSLRAVLASALVCLAWLLPTLSVAQPTVVDSTGAPATPELYQRTEPAEWGEVSKEILASTSFAADSNASAVILSDVGDLYYRFNLGVEMERHVRIKILNEAGFEHGTVSIDYYAEDAMQRVRKIKGTTYVLGEDGEVQTFEFDDDEVFIEEISDKWERAKFTLPNLKPGAVIEYGYELRSEAPTYLPPWSFQADEPTMYSAFEATIPDFFDVINITRGSEQYADYQNESVNSRFGQAKQHRWTMLDMPAIRDEPYMTTAKDYRSSMQIEVRRLLNPRTGQTMRAYLTSWPQVAEDLLDADYFGDDIDDRDVRRLARKVIEGIETPEEKMNAIYAFVQSSFKWDGNYGFIADQDVDDVLEARSGDVGEINRILTGMLREAGLEAHPALLSTRSHGKVIGIYPVISQFNYAVAAVRLPDAEEWTLLDASESSLTPGVLPRHALNGMAWVVREETPIWVPIDTDVPSQRSVFISGHINEDGSLEGSIQAKDSGYASHDGRNALDNNDGDVGAYLLDDVLNVLLDADLANTSAEGRDAGGVPLVTKGEIKVSDFAMVAGDRMYLPPILAATATENPFKSKTRTFPVDFAHPITHSYTLSLTLPEGFELEEGLPNRRISLPGDSGMYMRMMQVSGNRLMVRGVFQMKVTRVAPEYYGILRQFFQRAIANGEEQVVLKRIADSAQADETSDTSTGK